MALLSLPNEVLQRLTYLTERDDVSVSEIIEALLDLYAEILEDEDEEDPVDDVVAEHLIEVVEGTVLWALLETEAGRPVSRPSQILNRGLVFTTPDQVAAQYYISDGWVSA